MTASSTVSYTHLDVYKRQLLLCSDGFWEDVYEKEMASYRIDESPATWLSHLKALCDARRVNKEVKDNNTAIAVIL